MIKNQQIYFYLLQKDLLDLKKLQEKEQLLLR